MRKIYNEKSQADAGLIGICEAACAAIRTLISDERYRPTDGGDLSNLLEHYLVGAAALVYGNGRAFIQLAKSGLEREALQFQRHVMEYYYRARYYRENPQWVPYYWARCVKDERDILKEAISHHGSRERLTQFEKLVPMADEWIQKLPRKDKAKICPSIEVLAKRYAIDGSDYVMLYRWPSQITHATFLGLNYAWMNDGTPRFDSDIPIINARTAVVAEHLVSFIEAIKDAITVAVEPDTKAMRKSLRSGRSRPAARDDLLRSHVTRAPAPRYPNSRTVHRFGLSGRTRQSIVGTSRLGDCAKGELSPASLLA